MSEAFKDEATRILVCSLGLAITNISKNKYLYSTTPISQRILYIVGQGVLLLVYPLLGHLADVYLTRYRVLKSSLIVVSIIVCAGSVYQDINTIASTFLNSNIFYRSPTGVFTAIALIVYIIGFGLFDANIIQFGLDQLLEAPTPKLIAFIHWYYWSQSVGELALFYVYQCTHNGHMALPISDYHTAKKIFNVASFSFAVMLIILLQTTIVVIFCISKKHFYIQRAGLNPFKNIYKVLEYFWKHKVPEHRSAFTYWEEDIPRRIDLGKDKYCKCR